MCLRSYRTYAADGQEGTGLGMTIVKQLCGIDAGDREISSEVGKGRALA